MAEHVPITAKGAVKIHFANQMHGAENFDNKLRMVLLMNGRTMHQKKPTPFYRMKNASLRNISILTTMAYSELPYPLKYLKASMPLRAKIKHQGKVKSEWITSVLLITKLAGN